MASEWTEQHLEDCMAAIIDYRGKTPRNEWAHAQVSTIRLRLLKIAAEVRVSARRICLRYPRAYP